VAPEHADEPFGRILPRLLAERRLSLRELSRRLEMDPTHLSRIRRGQKRLPPDLPRQVAVVLGLPEDYFVETREFVIFDAVREDPALRERVYNEVASVRRRRRTRPRGRDT
jgi:transcriptional regulator with XRE-family HTH domain